MSYRIFFISNLIISLATQEAFAASLEGTLSNLVNAFTGRILPILAMGFLGKNIFGHVAGDPNARQDSIRIVVATACLLGLGGVWAFIREQVR